MKMNEEITLRKNGKLQPWTVRDLVELAKEDPNILDLPLQHSDPEGNSIAPVQAVCLTKDDNDHNVIWLYGESRGS